MNLFDEGTWRKPIAKRKTKIDTLLVKQKGRCARCRKSFGVMRVKPILHHIRKSNQLRSMQLLCPNCHTKAHEIKIRDHGWGEKETIVIRKSFGKKEPVKKAKQRRRKSRSLWDLNI
jgi:hypothetical protein